jgi:hypothetical protein
MTSKSARGRRGSASDGRNAPDGSSRARGRVWPWIVSVVIAMGFFAADTGIRLRSIAWMQGELGGPPPVDPASRTGYAGGQRGLILPVAGRDGYHWIIQTQQMLAGEGLRIRRVQYDNAPGGREVHWSSAFRWWLAGLAGVHHAATGVPIGLSVERVAAVANPALFVLFTLLFTVVIARTMGAFPAAGFAAACVAVSPYVEAFVAGNVDHHGIAVAACLATVLFLLIPSGGWRRDAPPQGSLAGEDRPPVAARHWFVASGVAGGIGLWISAATIAPVLIALGLGAVLAAAWVRRRPGGGEHPADLSLWRVWGIAGGTTSMVLYLVEYFPSAMGMRLEVNHPLYALCWAGGAELVHRCGRAALGQRVSTSSVDRAVLGVSLIAAALLPLTILLAPGTFLVGDAFLWKLHTDYIPEFQPFISNLRGLPWDARLRDVTLLPFVAVVLPLVTLRNTPSSARASLALGWSAGLVTLALAMVQTRWWVVAAAVWLAVWPVALHIVRGASQGSRSAVMRLLTVIAVVAVIAPRPVLAVRGWIRQGGLPPLDWEEATALVVRDIAKNVRDRPGSDSAIILTDPATTTVLIYLTGARGVGTLYWENVEGLKAAAAIYGAATDEEARRLIRDRGVTHLIVVSWTAFAGQYALLSRGQSKDAPIPDSAFVWRIVRSGRPPPWLRLYRYQLPDHEAFRQHWVAIYEVIPDATPPIPPR